MYFSLFELLRNILTGAVFAIFLTNSMKLYDSHHFYVLHTFSTKLNLYKLYNQSDLCEIRLTGLTEWQITVDTRILQDRWEPPTAQYACVQSVGAKQITEKKGEAQGGDSLS